MNREVTVWAPATIANLNAGFDALGCALSNPGEEIVMRTIAEPGVVRISAVHGADLDLNPQKNIAAVAARSFLREMGDPCGLELELFKQIKPGSGIGSSAASAAGAVVAANELLGANFEAKDLVRFALDGEQLASGVRHADNVAPALMGGLVFCPPIGAPIALPVPKNWHLLILHPQVEVKTSMSRDVLPKSVPLADAATQARWLGAFISACYRGDEEQALCSLEDVLVGPYRRGLIPYFDEIKALAIDAGARTGGISGSGPSTFWVCPDERHLHLVQEAVSSFMDQQSVPFHLFQSDISAQGAHVIR